MQQWNICVGGSLKSFPLYSKSVPGVGDEIKLKPCTTESTEADFYLYVVTNEGKVRRQVYCWRQSAFRRTIIRKIPSLLKQAYVQPSFIYFLLALEWVRQKSTQKRAERCDRYNVRNFLCC